VALSGTPVENRLEELWSLMHFANPGLLGGRSDFDERYAKPIAEGDARAWRGCASGWGPSCCGA
jgi:SNF2 family DNA or RNA helicase